MLRSHSATIASREGGSPITDRLTVTLQMSLRDARCAGQGTVAGGIVERPGVICAPVTGARLRSFHPSSGLDYSDPGFERAGLGWRAGSIDTQGDVLISSY